MFETQGRTRIRARDLPKKGSAFITSSDHWTKVPQRAAYEGVGATGCHGSAADTRIVSVLTCEKIFAEAQARTDAELHCRELCWTRPCCDPC